MYWKHRVMLSLCLMLTPLPAWSETPSLRPPPEPHLCVGYNPAAQNWDSTFTMALGDIEANCPDGYAFFSVDFPMGRPRPARNISLGGRCCPVPDGVLTNRHSYVAEQCPDNSVATGLRSERQVAPCPGEWGKCVEEWDRLEHTIRCTEIDSSRYQLGPPMQGYIMGFNLRLEPSASETFHYTSRGRIPIGIRYGVTRTGRLGLDAGGFVGFPWGSLFSARHSKTDIRFRQLQYRGAAGDPLAGTPVRMFPDCLALSDPLDPNATCLSDAGTTVSGIDVSPPAGGSGTEMPLGVGIRRHQFRVLQLFLATAVSLKRSFVDPSAVVDEVAILDRGRWRVNTVPELKDSVMANLVRTLADTDYGITVVRDRALAVGHPEIPASREYVMLRDEIARLFSDVSRSTSRSVVVDKLDRVIDLLRQQMVAFAAEYQLEGATPDAILPFTALERPELEPYGIIARGTPDEAIDRRSAQIVAAILADPPAAGRSERLFRDRPR